MWLNLKEVREMVRGLGGKIDGENKCSHLRRSMFN